MDRARVERARCALAVLSAAAALVLPLVGGSPSPAAELVALSLAVALASVALVSWCLAQPAPAVVTVVSRRGDDLPPLRGRATDPAHHPHAPRAPGRG